MAILVLTSGAATSFGQGCVTVNGANGQVTGPSIYLNTNGVPNGILSQLNNGASQWNGSSCNQNGMAFPAFIFGSQSTGSSRLINVVYDAGPGNGQCGNFNGVTVTLFGSATLANDPTRVVSCTPVMAENFAHELGHTLGLGDSSCNGYIMNNVQIDAQGNYNSRSVQADECHAAADKWTTPAEATPPPEGGGCEGRFLNIGDDCSPIVINFGRGDYHLTGANSPVLFDIAASGSPARIGWTAGGADEAFLWLDRNHNDVVDDGAELFGNATPQMDGNRAPNGFEALRVFDTNHDGIIDEHDSIWLQLLLWRDLNHDGVSQSSEITSVTGSGFTAISLDYHRTGRHDVFGNVFRYQSKIWIRHAGGQATPEPVYDIFFVPVP